MRPWIVGVLLLSLGGAAHWYVHRPFAHDPGVLVEAVPRQTEPADSTPIRHGDYELTPLADYVIEARVLSREDYRMDAGSALAPTDLAVGWQRMSDSAVIDQLDIRQSARFFTYHWPDTPPIPPEEIVRSAANMHMIPANDDIAHELAALRVGAIVTLGGKLVEARGRDGWRWRSSLRRDDSGAGACELMLLDSIGQR
jgi:erythromycin esterase-like protein